MELLRLEYSICIVEFNIYKLLYLKTVLYYYKRHHFALTLFWNTFTCSCIWFSQPPYVRLKTNKYSPTILYSLPIKENCRDRARIQVQVLYGQGSDIFVLRTRYRKYLICFPFNMYIEPLIKNWLCWIKLSIHGSTQFPHSLAVPKL